MYPVPLQDVPRLESTAGVEALQGPELRTIFLGFDQHRDELLDMPGTGKNPFKDLTGGAKAFYQAIDIDANQAGRDAQRVDPHRTHDRAGDQTGSRRT